MKKPTILILDDDRGLQTALRRTLSAMGYRVVERSNVPDGIEQCPAGARHAIDPAGPTPDVEAWGGDREARHRPDVPVVVLAGYEGDGSHTIVVRPQGPPCAARVTDVASPAAEPPRVPDSVA